MFHFFRTKHYLKDFMALRGRKPHLEVEFDLAIGNRNGQSPIRTLKREMNQRFRK